MIVNSSPLQLNLSGNLPKFNISAAPNEVITISLKKGDDIILKEFYLPDREGRINIDLHEVVNSLLEIEIPNFSSNVFHQEKAYGVFSAEISSTNGDIRTFPFSVIKGGIDASGIDARVFLAANFLTWQVQSKHIKFHDPEFLTYFSEVGAKVKVRAYPAGAAPQEIDMYVLPAGQLSTINLNYGHVRAELDEAPLYYDVWVDQDGTRLSYVQRYIFSQEITDFDNLFLFENSAGGIDTIRFTGELTEKNASEFSSAAFDDIVIEFDVKTEKSYEINSGFFPSERHRQWALEFINSMQKYFLQDGYLARIYSSQPEVASVPGELSDFSLKFISAKQTVYRNLNRSNDPLLNLEINTQQGEVFFLAPRLNELPWANNPDILIPVQYPYENFFRKISLSTYLNSSGGGSTGGNEVDPTVPYWVKAISQGDIDKWNNAAISTQYAENAGYSDEAGYAMEASFAEEAGHAHNAEQWDGNEFPDFLDQPVRETDHVKFASIETDTLNSKVYVSGFTGSGYKINPDGSAEFHSLTIRKDLNINVLNVREITGSGGSLAITNVAVIKDVTDMGAYWKCDIETDENTIAVQLRANDIVRCQVWDGKRLKYYSTRVTSVTTGSFNLSKAEKTGGGIPEAKDTVFQFGNTTDATRRGLLYLTNSDGGAPYLDVLDGITSESLAGKTKVRLGRLDGINDADFGELDGYGFYGQNVYVKGKIMVTGGNAATKDYVDQATLAAKYVSISGDQTFVYSKDLQPVPDKQHVTLTAFEYGFMGADIDRIWEYWNGAVWALLIGAFGLSVEVAHNSPAFNGSDSALIRFREGELFDQITLAKLYAGSGAITVVINSSYGNVFKNGNISTTLSAEVYYGGERVTDDIPESGFTWSRTSSDAYDDGIWNNAQPHSRTIEIDEQDVLKKATFDCEVEINIQ